MGVKGLLKFVSPACESTTVHIFRGKNLGVDMMCFICKSLFHDDYMAHLDLYMRLLLRIAGHLFLVFDGRAPHAKNTELRRRRSTNRPKITSEVIGKIVEYYRQNPRVTIVFAPGEADSQLAYMNFAGFVDVVVTEDSDLIVYGCPVILYKLRPFGNCVVYRRSEMRIPWNFRTFQRICLLCGCDYTNGLRGFGFQRALRTVPKQNPLTNYDKLDEFPSEKSPEEIDNELLDELAKCFPMDEECRRLFREALEAFSRQPVVCLRTNTVISMPSLFWAECKKFANKLSCEEVAMQLPCENVAIKICAEVPDKMANKEFCPDLPKEEAV